MTAGATRRNFLLFYPAQRRKEGCDRGSEVGTVHSERDGEGPVSPRKPNESGIS